MTLTTDALRTRTDMTVEEAVVRLRDRLAAEGFGVLTEIDIAATLEAKIGVVRPSYRLLGACRPQLASQALEVDPDVGLLLPCNIAIYKVADDEATTVVAMDPEAMVEMTGNELLAPIAAEARERLERVIAGLEAAARA